MVLHFYVGQDVYSYPCDTYLGWEDNLRAIALSLTALRAVDRYGVTRGREQYQGFKRLEAAAFVEPRFAAMQFIAQHAGVRTADVQADLEGAYRAAARRLHPDLNPQNYELFVQLQAHYGTLKNPVLGGVQ